MILHSSSVSLGWFNLLSNRNTEANEFRLIKSQQGILSYYELIQHCLLLLEGAQFTVTLSSGLNTKVTPSLLETVIADTLSLN